MPHTYVPEAGDIVWLDFDPDSGHEHAGHRPALVLSPLAYNTKSGLMLCCPMTSKIKHYPFEVLIAGSRPSVVLADQVKSMDWKARKVILKGHASTAELAEVRAKACALIDARP